MAINFPNDAVNNTPYYDAASDTTWDYNASSNSWTLQSKDALWKIDSGTGHITPFDASQGLYIPNAESALFGGSITIGGIDSNSNQIDDYEVGTFTPVLTGQTTDPTQDYVSQSGHYIKIGNLCYANAIVKMASSGIVAGSGTLRCNLPFVASSFIGGSMMIARAFTANAPINIQTIAGSAECSFLYTYNQDQTSAAEIKNNTQMNFSLVYQIN